MRWSDVGVVVCKILTVKLVTSLWVLFCVLDERWVTR